MLSAAGHAVTFNGEIYNYRELKAALPGYPFRSKSDTEVLLALYEKYGEACLDRLQGIFAFALWDEQKRCLFLARDRAGKKPLYYHFGNGRFSFASEIKALLQLPWIRAELDEEALYHFLTFNQLPPPLTLFTGIRKLPESGWCRIDAGGALATGSYWEVAYGDWRKAGEAETAGRLLAELERAVALRMVSDVPVGAFLSGGVDSSAVVALMSRQSGAPVKTYSIGFENAPGYDELQHAKKIARRFGTEHFEQTVTPRDLVDFLPKVVDVFDEPLADTTAIPIYFLARLARENGTVVVLTGDGPDELLLGYRGWMRYLAGHRAYAAWLHLPEPVRRQAARLGERRASPRLAELLARAARGEEMFWGGAKSFKEHAKSGFLSAGFRQRMRRVRSHDILAAYRRRMEAIVPKKPGADYGDWMSYLGFRFLHPNRYLFRTDRLGMAHGVEARMPFLDPDFVCAALSVPTRLKTKNGQPKYILKKALEPLLGAETVYRRKQGFNVPIREWGGRVMTDYIASNAGAFCKAYDLFDEAGLHAQVRGFLAGKKEYANNLWTVYFLMAWLDRWMKKNSGSGSSSGSH
jgi:asparagine synthase (glutamine-hydrolysing)